MASPIFRSHSNTNLLSLIKGIQLAILGAYRLLQNQLIFENANLFKFVLKSIILSAVLQAIKNGVEFIVLYIALFIKWWKPAFKLEGFQEITELFNIEVFLLLVIYMYYIDIFDDTFRQGVKYVDYINNKREEMYYNGLSRKIDYNKHYNFITNKLINIANNNLILFLVSKFVKLDKLVIIAIIWNQTIDKIGFNFGLLISSINLFFLNSSTIIKYYNYLQVIELLLVNLLHYHYLQHLSFSTSSAKTQISKWIETRYGILIGFQICYFLLLWKFKYLTVLILLIETISLAFLITELTDPIPPKQNEIWLIQQIYYNKINLRNFKVSNNGFKPVPFSYLMDEELNSSHSNSNNNRDNSEKGSSVFATPVGSSLELNRMI